MSLTGSRRLRAAVAEDGNSLPATLIAFAVGLLLIVPLLSSSSTGMLRTRAADQALLQQYALDAGVEYGIWKLRYDSAFRASVDAVPLTPVAVSPGMTLNGFSPAITATALDTSGWEPLTDAPGNIQVGGALAFANASGVDYLYAFRGGLGASGRAFWRYQLSTGTWDAAPRDAPNNKGDGAALTWNGGDYIYAFRGNNQRTFWRYSIPGDVWVTRRQAPDTVNGGGALAFAGGYVYALRGDNSTDFWCFDPGPPPFLGQGTWNALPPTPGNVGPGGALVYAGANTFYALQGGTQAGFWRYIGSGCSGGSWTNLSDVPAAVGNGGALAFAGGFVYAFEGDNTIEFWRYSPPPADSWNAETVAPGFVQDGGSLAFANGQHVYGLRGNSRPDFWRYRIAPPQYDIIAQTSGRTTTIRIQISGTTVTVLWWDVQ